MPVTMPSPAQLNAVKSYGADFVRRLGSPHPICDDVATAAVALRTMRDTIRDANGGERVPRAERPLFLAFLVGAIEAAKVAPVFAKRAAKHAAKPKPTPKATPRRRA